MLEHWCLVNEDQILCMLSTKMLPLQVRLNFNMNVFEFQHQQGDVLCVQEHKLLAADLRDESAYGGEYIAVGVSRSTQRG